MDQDDEALDESRLKEILEARTNARLKEVQAEVFALARTIGDAGFAVSRAKIEATGSNRDIPESDEDAAQHPRNYFEFHVKVMLSSDEEHAALAELVRPTGAHLSRNARKVRPDGRREHFITLRVYDVGREQANRRFSALRKHLDDASVAWTQPVREYTVFDSNVAVDQGWLD